MCLCKLVGSTNSGKLGSSVFRGIKAAVPVITCYHTHTHTYTRHAYKDAGHTYAHTHTHARTHTHTHTHCTHVQRGPLSLQCLTHVHTNNLQNGTHTHKSKAELLSQNHHINNSSPLSLPLSLTHLNTQW